MFLFSVLLGPARHRRRCCLNAIHWSFTRIAGGPPLTSGPAPRRYEVNAQPSRALLSLAVGHPCHGSDLGDRYNHEEDLYALVQ